MKQAITTDTNKGQHPDVDKFAAIIGAIWPGVSLYGPGERFRIRNRDRLGHPIPNALRGRTGTVISVDGPVALGDLHRKADVRNNATAGLGDIARLLGVEIEMVYFVSYDDEPDAIDPDAGVLTESGRLSHTWMEPESAPRQPDLGWIDEKPLDRSPR
ncbi:hypothetical protein QDT91_29710 (plasmid) [Mycolicibacterium aubagnense]|uniref:hypothetical protein n=1 Tax=Mycolicibacterium aubagnense TaxID=319707 RepID=UPI00244E010E|nr:hypothetical protein [Mycolicibacterium aubagnense]WGI36195.1 hypothetical protein QDT91_29710 [Mycolicibacterium aubagnense]